MWRWVSERSGSWTRMEVEWEAGPVRVRLTSLENPAKMGVSEGESRTGKERDRREDWEEVVTNLKKDAEVLASHNTRSSSANATGCSPSQDGTDPPTVRDLRCG